MLLVNSKPLKKTTETIQPMKRLFITLNLQRSFNVQDNVSDSIFNNYSTSYVVFIPQIVNNNTLL